MGRIRLQKRELVWFGCFYIFLLPQTMLPSNDKYANQSCCFGQHKMATLFGEVEKYTRNQFQLSESVPFDSMPFAIRVFGCATNGADQIEYHNESSMLYM